MSETTQIKLSSGQVVDVLIVTGVVADDQHTSQTSFYSTGGGGYVGPQGGYVAAPVVRSETTTRQKFWITDDKGKDHELTLTDTQLPLRVGQRVTARFVARPSADRWRVATFTNHSADLFYTWAEEQDAPLDLLATDRGQISATAWVLGGAAVGWLAYQTPSVIPSGVVAWFCLLIVVLSPLAVFNGFMMRVTRRSRLRDALRAEYVEAVNALK